MGIHWRSRILSPQIGALAQAGWGLGEWTNGFDPGKRDLPVDDYYRDWANAQFGRESDKIADIFTELDGGPLCLDIDKSIETHLPRTTSWGGPGPGLLFANRMPWNDVATNYAFVDRLTTCESQIKGPANRERFDYWLNTFRYLRSLAHTACVLGELEIAMERATEQTDRDAQLHIINDTVMPLRKESGERWGEAVRCLLATVGSPGEMGTIANLELHNLERHQVLSRYDRPLSLALGKDIPPVELPKDYRGPARIIVPTKRTLLETGEDLNPKVLLPLAKPRGKTVKLFWRSLWAATGPYETIQAGHVGRGCLSRCHSGDRYPGPRLRILYHRRGRNRAVELSRHRPRHERFGGG